jgi:hypothetical protein
LRYRRAQRNVTHLIEHLHLYLSLRTTDTTWWAHDIWDLRADPRIPQREHEPGHDQSLKIAALTPVWLREGVRFWLRTDLDACCCAGPRRWSGPATWPGFSGCSSPSTATPTPH